MSFLKILVVDDEHEKRKKPYEHFESKLGLATGHDVMFEFLPQPSALLSWIKQNRYAAIILDAVYSEPPWQGFSVRQAFSEIGDGIPVALISSQWDHTQTREFGYAWRQRNCGTFLQLRDIDGSHDGCLEYALAQLSSLLAEHLDKRFDLVLGSGDLLRILHVSDLQIGGIPDAEIELQSGAVADFVLEKSGGKAPAFVAFTGDVTERARPDEFRRAHQWFDSFVDRLGIGRLPCPRLLLVPGNHDVNLGLSAATRARLKKSQPKGSLKPSYSIGLDDKAVSDGELSRFALLPYREFKRGVTDRRHIEEGTGEFLPWVEARYRHLGVVFYGLNTAAPANPFGLPAQSVDGTSLDLIKREIAEILKSDDRLADPRTLPVVVGLTHHSPFPDNGDRSVANPSVFENFLANYGSAPTTLVLHGHVHEHGFDFRGKTQTIVSSGPTLYKNAAARPEDSLRGFNLIELRRKSGVVDEITTQGFGWVGQTVRPTGEKGRYKRQPNGMFGPVFD